MSGAERQRRYQAHRAGDHSLCLPSRPCRDPLAPSPAASLSSPPAAPADHLDPRQPAPSEHGELTAESQELYDDLSPQMGPVHRLLLMQACRAADRLSRINALIDGRHRRGEWLRLVEGEAGELRVVVDDLFAEERQQATALKGLLAELRQAGVLEPKDDNEGGGSLASLVEAAARRRASSG